MHSFIGGSCVTIMLSSCRTLWSLSWSKIVCALMPLSWDLATRITFFFFSQITYCIYFVVLTITFEKYISYFGYLLVRKWHLCDSVSMHNYPHCRNKPQSIRGPAVGPGALRSPPVPVSCGAGESFTSLGRISSCPPVNQGLRPNDREVLLL